LVYKIKVILKKNNPWTGSLFAIDMTREKSPDTVDLHSQWFYILKTAGLFQPKFGSNMDKPKCKKKSTVESESWGWVNF